MKWQDLRQSQNVEIDCLGQRAQMGGPETEAAFKCQAEVADLKQRVTQESSMQGLIFAATAGVGLFLGTQFAPIQDRDEAGKGFTHKRGDIVSISARELGTLVNRVNHCDKITPWTFGVTDLMRNLSRRGLI